MKQELYCFEVGLRSTYYVVFFSSNSGKSPIHIHLTDKEYYGLVRMGVKENMEWVPEEFIKLD